ncbi:relaxase [Faecalibacterium prausnitzii]|uniref:relaxase/mobilization nuclease domain-containing protein n=1 Tax=Faecalibacterium prausnitzii TaxID=853 RepID=UPI000DE23346|nr:relaxase/mobilization nuclease domain-containing protein [Faecalibacterium prausnitzii]AXB27444.1 relaxase [Faecalibacterium prausnitzii]
MATLKHISSKNSDYTAIEAYLIYQHDEFSGKVILDKQGRPTLRESYLLDTLECGNFSFATACLLANRKYGKNTQHGDIKSHQYIISFDPRDAADNGLTMEKSQALGLKFCEENFPGHPAIVCTHPDGHNRSGNIHVHIVIGSIRMREVERKPYMQKPRDWREGMKHSSTAQTMRHLRVEVMELCESAGLYQIDLLNGSKERVSEAEYWARRRGQQKLDLANAALTAAGQPPQQKKFETAKETLRKQISDVLDTAMSFEDFSDRLLQQYGITVKESRGRLSYLPAGRTKFIRAHSIGDKFDKAAVLATLQANAERKPKAQFKQDTIGKLIDIQSRMTEGKGIGYKRWLTKHNLKIMAQTVKLLQEKGLTDEGALNQRIAELETKYHNALAVVKDLEGRMKFNKELRYHVAAYASTKTIAQQLKTAKRPAAFEEQHRAELTAYRAAAAYFKANDLTKLPSPKKLEAEYAQHASEKAKFYEQYKEAKEELLKLKTAKQNVASFFREEEQTQQER